VEEFGFDYANRLNLYKKTEDTTLQTHFSYLASPMGDRFSKRNGLAETEEAYMYEGRDVVGDYTKSGASTFTHLAVRLTAPLPAGVPATSIAGGNRRNGASCGERSVCEH
jgi:hypothetical protein